MNLFYFTFVFIYFLKIVYCCSSDDECEGANTFCNGSTCDCKTGYLQSSDKLNCLPYVTEYNGDCTEDSQCEWLGEHSHCDYVCRCEEGYRWYLGKCTKYSGLGGACEENINCYDGYNPQALTCINGQCVCNEGYYQRGDIDCRKMAENEGDFCALDVDCQTPGTICHLGECTKNNLKSMKQTVEIEEMLPKMTYASLPIINCTSDEDCPIENSECYPQTKTCVCKHKYFFQNDACIAEIGVNTSCKNDTDCTLKPSKCLSGICYCRDYFFTADGNRECVKTMIETNSNCLSKEWCYALGPFVYCSSEGTCSCSKVASLDNDLNMCIKQSDEIVDCTEDYQCKKINGICIDEACACKENHVLENGRCTPTLGGPCDEDLLCETENSECLNGICVCKDEYVPFENLCYKTSDVGEDCEINEQCLEKTKYTKCSNNICRCTDDRTLYDGACFPIRDFGSYCNNRLECLVSLNDTLGNDVVCRNYKCQCGTGLTLVDDQCSSGTYIEGSVVVLVSVFLLKFSVC